MRVLGIDPGTIRTGVGVIEKQNGRLTSLHYETIEVPAALSLAKRLKRIYDALSEVLRIYEPDCVALENIFFSRNFRSAVKLGEARSIAILAATNRNMEVIEYPPARVKESISGNGRASKPQIQFMIRHLLGLKETPPVDAADALAVAVCHLNAENTRKIEEERGKHAENIFSA